MSFLDLVKKRYSVRKYSQETIEKDKIDRCIEAARLAPSASNAQPWKYIIVDDAAKIEKIANASNSNIIGINKFVKNSKIIAVLVSEKGSIKTRIGSFLKRRPFHLIDLGISAQHFCLQAHEEQLGTCMVGWFNERKIKRLLKVPWNKRVNLLITVGYPETVKVPKKKRKDISEVCTYNKY